MRRLTIASASLHMRPTCSASLGAPIVCPYENSCISTPAWFTLAIISLFTIYFLFARTSDDAARRSLLADEHLRPNALIAAAHTEIARLRTQLVPLLDEAERRMRGIEARHFVVDGALLRRIAAASGRSIVQNSGSGGHVSFDSLVALRFLFRFSLLDVVNTRVNTQSSFPSGPF